MEKSKYLQAKTNNIFTSYKNIQRETFLLSPGLRNIFNFERCQTITVKRNKPESQQTDTEWRRLMNM